LTHAQALTVAGATPHVFPPALVPVLRERLASIEGSLAEVSDGVLIELLTTIFFAGLGTYESEHHPIGVVFLGRSSADVVIPEGTDVALYHWKIVRFETPRPFVIPELVKLAVAGTDRRIYTGVNILEDGRVAITGLAREGFKANGDPFVRILASRPGCLSIRCGRDLILGYEYGSILTGGENLVFMAGPVRHALESIARAADMNDASVPDYLDAVRSLVREMAAHGHGGLLVISQEERPLVPSAPYRMALDSSIGTLLRLARRIEPKSPSAELAFAQLLRNALLTETERVIEEMGALTAIDGAVVLSRSLALIAFGAILHVGRSAVIREAIDAEGTRHRTIDFGSRGTRHRAAATYAADHPGAVVFVASEDGHVSCLFRDRAHPHVLLWRLGPADAHSARRIR
jgi:DNA integrity scanning protein DisA with diadenylate cyclase activity